MGCPAAQALFEDYAQAAMEHFEATDTLSNLVGQHGLFEERKEIVGLLGIFRVCCSG